MQEQTGIPYARWTAASPGSPVPTASLGELTGRADDADKLARYAEDTLKTVLGRIEPIATLRGRGSITRGPRGLTTGLGGSINVETIELIGRNVAGETQGGLANVSIEQILVWNPEVIVTIDQSSPPPCATIPPGRRSRPCATTGSICRPKCRSAGWIFRQA